MLQNLQQQMMFILQQRQQLDQYRVLLNQQLLSLQQTPLDNLALYQQQLLQLRQQQFQATEAIQRLELQYQQINFKMMQLQHYNSMNVLSQPTALSQAKQQQPMVSTAANLGLTQRYGLSQVQPSPGLQAGNVTTGNNTIAPTSTVNPNSTLQFQRTTKGVDDPVLIKPSVNEGLSGATASGKKEVDEDSIDDEMEHLLGLSQSDVLAAKEEDKMVNDDGELVDQYYCKVCGVSFKSESSDTKVEDGSSDTSLVSMFHGTNHETHLEHVKSKTHQDNMFSYGKFMSFKEQSYNEPRKQLDNLLDDTARFDSANLDRYVFSVRSKLRDFDQEIEEFKDAYKWRNAYSRMGAFVEEMASISRQMMKMRAVESIKVAPPPTLTDNLADMVFIDDEDDLGLDIDDGSDARRRKKSNQKK